jgi:EpsI family protein
MIVCNHNRKQVVLSAITASLLMCFFGLIYRVVAAPVHRTPLDPNVLQRFPLHIGEWTGEESPIDPRVRSAIDADAYVSRRYSRRNGCESVSLYLPCGADASELLQHIPENCYVGAGWTLVDRRASELVLDGGSSLPCSIVQFARGGLDMRKLVLLHFLVADGEYFTTFSDVAKMKGWRHFAGIKYAAQVQVVTSADKMPVDTAIKVVTDFALDAAPVMERLFANLATGRTTEESGGE